MTPADFPGMNAVLKAPPGLEESQVMQVGAMAHEIQGGSCDGLFQVVVAYHPTVDDLAELNNGGAIFLSVMGGLPPHYLSTNLHDATHPA